MFYIVILSVAIVIVDKWHLKTSNVALYTWAVEKISIFRTAPFRLKQLGSLKVQLLIHIVLYIRVKFASKYKRSLDHLY